MINGVDPILIFSFFKNTPSSTPTKFINIVPNLLTQISFPPIPLYLSESLTGIYVDTEDKNIDIETTVDTLASGDAPIVNQKGIISTIKIGMLANKNSIGLSILMSLMDLILPKVTSKECSIVYINGPVTIFGGKLHSFSASQNSNTDLMTITLELTKGQAPIGEINVQNNPTTAPLNNTGSLPAGSAVPPPTGPGPGGGASIPIGAGRLL